MPSLCSVSVPYLIKTLYRNPLLVLQSPSTCLESLVEFNQLVGQLDTLSSSSNAVLLL